MKKPASTSQPIHPLLAERWSPRAFDPACGVGSDEIAALLEAARWAPSSFGEEPWGYVVCDRATNPEAWEKLFGCLVEGNQGWAKNAPLLILSVGRKEFGRNGKPNRHWAHDTGAATLSLVLQAEALGLRAHQMSGFDAGAAAAAFGVPEGHECLSVIAVGKQAEADTLEDGAMADRERAERTRKPLGELFFDGNWGEPCRPE